MGLLTIGGILRIIDGVALLCWNGNSLLWRDRGDLNFHGEPCQGSSSRLEGKIFISGKVVNKKHPINITQYVQSISLKRHKLV